MVFCPNKEGKLGSLEMKIQVCWISKSKKKFMRKIIDKKN